MRSDGERAVALRMAGGSYASIADQLGLTVEEVEDLVAAELAGRAGESSEITARLDLARLDALLLAVWKSADRGDTTAVSQALKITGQRAALLDRIGDGGHVDDDGEHVSVADRLAAIKAAHDPDPGLAPVTELSKGGGGRCQKITPWRHRSYAL